MEKHTIKFSVAQPYVKKEISFDDIYNLYISSKSGVYFGICCRNNHVFVIIFSKNSTLNLEIKDYDFVEWRLETIYTEIRQKIEYFCETYYNIGIQIISKKEYINNIKNTNIGIGKLIEKMID